MVAVRRPGDPWYTAVYKNPHTRWWGPAAPMFLALLASFRLLADDSWVMSSLQAALVVSAYSYLARATAQRAALQAERE